MQKFEYLVRPAQYDKGRFGTGQKAAAQHFEDQINELAQDGWEFQRLEMINFRQRRLLRASVQVECEMLVFKRLRDQDQPETEAAGADLLVLSQPILEPAQADTSPDLYDRSGPTIESAVVAARDARDADRRGDDEETPQADVFKSNRPVLRAMRSR